MSEKNLIWSGIKAGPTVPEKPMQCGVLMVTENVGQGGDLPSSLWMVV